MKHAGVLSSIRDEQKLKYIDITMQSTPSLAALRDRSSLMADFTDAAAREVKYVGKYAKARVYGEGERPGRTLAHLLRPHYQSVFVTQLDTDAGDSLTKGADIITAFLDYYIKLYQTRYPPSGQALNDYLQEIAIVWLEEGQQDFLASPIDADEIKRAIRFSQQLCPGI